MENPDWVYDWAFEHFTGKLRERIQQAGGCSRSASMAKGRTRGSPGCS